jgi:nucleotide-binding universal stress UspA family protein
MYRKILVALEGKHTDEAAIAYAAALARQASAEITLLQVIAIAGDDAGLRHLQMEPGANGWKRKNKAEANLKTWRQQIQKNGEQVKTEIVVDDRSEADEIVDFANAGRFDLIVMAADGRPWWQRALFGCIADGVHRKASVPTLFVSDGTRREKVASKQQPASLNPIFDSFGDAHIC